MVITFWQGAEASVHAEIRASVKDGVHTEAESLGTGESHNALMFPCHIISLDKHPSILQTYQDGPSYMFHVPKCQREAVNVRFLNALCIWQSLDVSGSEQQETKSESLEPEVPESYRQPRSSGPIGSHSGGAASQEPGSAHARQSHGQRSHSFI